MVGVLEDGRIANGTDPSYYRYDKVKSVNSEPDEDVEEPNEYEPGSSSDTPMLEDCLPTVPNYRTFSSSSAKQRASVLRLPEGIVPSYRAVFLVANAALGAGLLNFPQAYKNAGGLKNAFAVQSFLLVFIIGAFLILARCANRSQASTYQDVVNFMCGSKIKTIAEVLIIIYFFGGCITYLIIIGDQASKAALPAAVYPHFQGAICLIFSWASENATVLTFALKTNKSHWYTDKKFLMILISTGIILPLCIPKRLKVLSYSSFLGGIGAFYITFMIVYKYYFGIYKPAELEPSASTAEEDIGWTSTFNAIPVICFGFQCHVSSVAVYADLKDRSMGRFFCVAVVATIICTLAYSLSGTFGYLTFEQKTNSDILLNYDSNDTLANIARIMIVLILFSSFAIITFCARTAVDSMLLSWRRLSPEKAAKHERCRRLTETFLWFGLALLLAAVVPNIGVAIALIGGLAALFIFVFTGLCLLKSVNILKPVLTAKDITLLVISALYVVLGIFIFGENTTKAIMRDVEAKSLY